MYLHNAREGYIWDTIWRGEEVKETVGFEEFVFCS